MTSLHHDFQKLIEAESAKANTNAILLAVQSGDEQVTWRGCAKAPIDAPFYIASLTKMFTATLILQLKDKGMLSLDQTAQSILVEHDLSPLHMIKGIAYGPQLTIRQLLHQTSGLADYFEGHLLKMLRQGRDQAYDLQDVLRMTQSLSPQARPDSGKSYYSDTNYQLLGAIIETVTGQSFQEVLHRQICVPLGLSHTRVFERQDGQRPPPLAVFQKTQQLDLSLSLSSMGADGGIVSTIEDVLMFLRAYMKHELFDPSNVSQVRQFNPMSFPLQYGLGLMRFHLPRWMTVFRDSPELIGHSGASGSFAFYAPAVDVYMVGVFNQLDAPQRPFKVMMQILRLLRQHGAGRCQHRA